MHVVFSTSASVRDLWNGGGSWQTTSQQAMQVTQAISQNKLKKGKLQIYRLGVEHSLFRLGLSTLIFVLIRVKLLFYG